jgi:hypothetical protein
MAAKKQPKSKSYPRTDIPCPKGDTEDEAGQNYARVLTSPGLAALRIIKGSEAEFLAKEIDAPGLLAVLKEQGLAVNDNDLG